MLYNILLPINHYVSSIPIKVTVKTLNIIRTSHCYFVRSLGHCISPSITSDLLDISNPPEYADMCN